MTHWAYRLRRLRAACGWKQVELARRFGVCELTVKRIMEGGRPKVAIVRKLAALEGAYAGEIEAFERGEIQVWWGRRNGRMYRRDWRPEDREVVAAVAGVSAGGRFGVAAGAGEASASKVVRVFVKGGFKRKKDRGVGVGRPAAGSVGQGAVARGGVECNPA